MKFKLDLNPQGMPILITQPADGGEPTIHGSLDIDALLAVFYHMAGSGQVLKLTHRAVGLLRKELQKRA